MSTSNNDRAIIPTATTAVPATAVKTKKSKKKNKSPAAAVQQSEQTEIGALDCVVVSQVSSDLQNRLQLADAEDSGFGGEANGHDELLGDSLENAHSGHATPVVRSGPDDDEHQQHHQSSTDQSSDCATADNSSSASVTAVNAKPPVEAPPAIEYVSYQNELQMPDIMRLIQKDLSEPYSIYTYRYFIHNWPKLCFLSMHGDKCVGAIVCKLDIHRQIIKRGYIAMLAVDKDYRKLKIGTQLVQNAIYVSLKMLINNLHTGQ